MKVFRSHFIFIAYIAFVIMAAAFQASVWNIFFPNIPGPLLWIAPLVFFAVHKNFFPGLMQSYALGVFVAYFSNAPLKLLWMPILVFYSVVFVIRDRFYWRGTGYLAAMTFLSAVLFHITYLTVSLVFEKSPTAIMPIERIVQSVLTPVFTLPFYFLFEKIETFAVSNSYDSTPTSSAEGEA